MNVSVASVMLDEYVRVAEQRDAAWAALRQIVAEAASAWEYVDDLDDTGAHVGVARYHRTKADGLSMAAAIARAALEDAQP